MAPPTVQTLQRLAAETGYQLDTLEKVLRLLEWSYWTRSRKTRRCRSVSRCRPERHSMSSTSISTDARWIST